MAPVIKCLLTAECVARTYELIKVQPIKEMYFLYGWQPETLIRFVLWFSTRTVGTQREIYRSRYIKAPDFNIFLEHVETSQLQHTFLNSNEQNNYTLNETESEMGRSLFQSNGGSAYPVVAQIHLVCQFTASLQFYGMACFLAFEVTTTIIR